jgi:hypothetical protein
MRLAAEITLVDIDHARSRLRRTGFRLIWLLSVWQTSAAGRAVSRGNPNGGASSQPFCATGPRTTSALRLAITAHTVSDTLGGSAGYAFPRKAGQMRHRLMMLDVVPNHTAPDHPWMNSHPDYYMEAKGR